MQPMLLLGVCVCQFRRFLIGCLLIPFTCVSVLSDGIPAFPGAEGFGSTTPGGRGGRIIEVTNTEDSGKGSFREAVEIANGPRIIVFRTGGRVHLKKGVTIRNPFITIAGQTAPGRGFCLSNAPLIVGTHDVVVRGLRIRPGDDPSGPRPETRDGITISSSYTNQEVYNVVIDHCSISWGIDENISTWQMPGKPTVHDVTIQWCISSEALYDSIHPDGPHSMGMLVGTNQNISIHHNLFAHNNQRNPLISGTSKTEFSNNIVYNWRSAPLDYASNGKGPHLAAATNNQFIPGPATRKIGNGTGRHRKGILIHSLADGSKLFLEGNIGPGRESKEQPEWDVATSEWVRDSDVAQRYRASSPPLGLSGVTVQDVEKNRNSVLENVGAVWPEWDTVDKRIINDVTNRKGGKGNNGIIDSQFDVGGWPRYNKGTPVKDNDHDGMADAWENLHGFDSNDPSDAVGDPDGDVYTNIEEFLNDTNPHIAEGNTQPNAPPIVDAGEARTVELPNVVKLVGNVTDDGLPDPSRVVTLAWSVVNGTGDVSFSDSQSLETTATFSEPGTYKLRLTANDSELTRFDDVIVTVRAQPSNSDPGPEDDGEDSCRFNNEDHLKHLSQHLKIFTRDQMSEDDDINCRHPASWTIYEDAEDAMTSGWYQYRGGSIGNIVGGADGSGRAIEIIGDVENDVFSLTSEDGSEWNNDKEFYAAFSVSIDEPGAAVLYFQIDTDVGIKYMVYTDGETANSGDPDLISIGLGAIADGQWHSIIRNLPDDLNAAFPGTKVVSVKKVFVYGSLRLDNLALINFNDTLLLSN